MSIALGTQLLAVIRGYSFVSKCNNIVHIPRILYSRRQASHISNLSIHVESSSCSASTVPSGIRISNTLRDLYIIS